MAGLHGVEPGVLGLGVTDLVRQLAPLLLNLIGHVDEGVLALGGSGGRHADGGHDGSHGELSHADGSRDASHDGSHGGSHTSHQ